MTNSRRSQATVDQYRTRVRQLQTSAIERQTPSEIFELTGTHPDGCSIRDLLNEFLLWSEGKSRSSWELYRSAVLWHMRSTMGDSPTEESMAAYSDMNKLRYPAPPDRKKREIKKPTGIPKVDLDKIINALLNSNQPSKNVGVKTQCWLLAALATGLRPSEWESAALEQIDETRWAVICNNSKRKISIPAHMEVGFYKTEYPDLDIKNRFDIEAHGFESVHLVRKMTRRIEINERDAGWVQNHLDGISEHIRQGGTFEQYYDNCRHALVRACDHEFQGKKRYSLYVMRHQFAANMKNLYSKEEVADLMGHDDVGSAPKDYASRRFGHAEFISARRSTQPDQATPTTAQEGETVPATAQTPPEVRSADAPS